MVNKGKKAHNNRRSTKMRLDPNPEATEGQKGFSPNGLGEVHCDVRQGNKRDFGCGSKFVFIPETYAEQRAKAFADGWTATAEVGDICPGCNAEAAYKAAVAEEYMAWLRAENDRKADTDAS